MKRPNRFIIGTTIIVLLSLTVSTGMAVYIWNHLSLEQAQNLNGILTRFYLPVLGIFAVLSASAGFGIEYIYRNYIYPLKRISSEAAIIYKTNPSHRLYIDGGRDIQRLTGILNDFADMFENLNKDITEQILSARKETEKERNLLAAIMAELPSGVIICNKSGRIILYNTLAKKIFSSKGSRDKPEQYIGLGRSIFHFMDKSLIAHAIDEVQERLSNNEAVLASYFITPVNSTLLLNIETIPVLDKNREMTGFILAFDDISHRITRHDRIENLMFAFKQVMRTTLEKTGVMIRDLTELAIDDSETRMLYEKEFLSNKKLLIESLDDIASRTMDETIPKIPLSRLDLPQFLSSLQKKARDLYHIDLQVTSDTDYQRILADAYSFGAGVLFLLTKLSQITGLKNYQMNVTSQNGGIVFEVRWSGRPASRIQIENIMLQKIKTLPSFDYVIHQNGAELRLLPENSETCTKVTITIKAQVKTAVSAKSRGVVIAESRPEFYDFDLFQAEDDTKGIYNIDLRKIIYTVFDTETTGLDPEGGDEIISIGAVRIVNNRIVYQDIFEELIDPKRDIPIESYNIHGLSYEMLQGKPDINKILPLFHIYTYDTVLIGHNIAFDMKMMKIKEASTQTRFDNPVLDTLLLSAALNPMNSRHDMENIAKRLGVKIIGRHTALGDAIVTAEIFLKLIPLLNANGIFTLKNALDASQKSYYSRLKY